MNGPLRVYVIVGLVLLAAGLILVFSSGCALTKGRIKGPGVTVQAQKDGNGASLAQEHATGVLALPAGSKVTTVKWQPVAWQPAINGRPEVPAQPGREETTVVLSKDSTWQKDETKIAADTGVIDNTVAVRRIQAAENRYLLFAAIGAALVALFFVYIKYPTPALMCGGASVVFFLAWKLADLPDWFYVIGVVGAVGAVLMWRAHDRGEREGVKAGLAGEVEPKNPPVVKTEP